MPTVKILLIIITLARRPGRNPVAAGRARSLARGIAQHEGGEPLTSAIVCLTSTLLAVRLERCAFYRSALGLRRSAPRVWRAEERASQDVAYAVRLLELSMEESGNMN